MLTRRSFLAALVMAPVASKAVPVAAPAVEWKDRLWDVPARESYYVFTKNSCYYVERRRDEGDTILELR